jgi:hypothetical protein
MDHGLPDRGVVGFEVLLGSREQAASNRIETRTPGMHKRIPGEVTGFASDLLPRKEEKNGMLMLHPPVTKN